MIILDRLTKVVMIGDHRRTILSSISLEIPSDRVIALFATSELDKKAFIHLLTGATLPTSGHYRKPGRVSFPVGSLPGIARDHSVRANVAHVARLYGMDTKKTVDFVEQVAGIGSHFDRPIRLVPRNLFRTVAQIVGFSVPFDCYVTMGEPAAKGKDEGVAERCLALFEMRAQQAGMIISARRPRFVQQHADMSLLLHEGQLHLFDTVEEGWDRLQRLGVREADPDESVEDDTSPDYL